MGIGEKRKRNRTSLGDIPQLLKEVDNVLGLHSVRGNLGVNQEFTYFEPSDPRLSISHLFSNLLQTVSSTRQNGLPAPPQLAQA